ncbi:MAG TPA: type II 3-dehydroquinate dehydratase [Candidatus Eremiobacteraceae bacterium]|nr:type II 3-dehydroquinate dehydratase [Candidatus Eremiobacteraceae bacterium]
MKRERNRKMIAVIHGPNLNLLGTREPAVYGTTTLREIDVAIVRLCTELGVAVTTEQHNGEGALIDAVQAAAARGAAIVINPGAYSHYSFALRDALSAAATPKVEAHLSNLHARDAFRKRSVVSAAVDGYVAGFGVQSYLLAVRAAVALLDRRKR